MVTIWTIPGSDGQPRLLEPAFIHWLTHRNNQGTLITVTNVLKRRGVAPNLHFRGLANASAWPRRYKRLVRLAAVAIMLVLSTVVGAHVSPARAAGIAGMSVLLDPGHGGANDSSITRQVPTGRGGTKDCETTGTSTDDGYPEHAFNWDLANRIAAELTSMGVVTKLSRSDDNSVAPCNDQRAAAANAMHPDAEVSIHADGGPAAGHGFHVNYSDPPLNSAQSGPAVQLADTMRDSLIASGMQPSTYIGNDGLYGRADLTGLNLAEYPAVLVEVGNMRNRNDAAEMETGDGRQLDADAITHGIVAYLMQKAGSN